MKKPIKHPVVFLLFVVCLVSVASPQKNKYFRWLHEEVYWLITPEEKRAFQKLKTEKEKEKFIALFWAKRDPFPQTHTNEFKEAYLANLAFVNQKYTRGQDMGWKTDVGKVLLFFGMPADRQTNPETWIYEPIPFLKIDSPFAIVWDAVEGVGFVINKNLTDKVALDAMDHYSRRSIQHPNLTEIPDVKKSFQRDLRGWEMKLLDEASAEEPSHADIPFEPAFYFSKAEQGATSMALVYFLDPKESRLEKAVLFGRVTGEDEQPKDYRQETQFKKDDDYRQVVLPILPGTYSVILGLKDALSERYSVRRHEIRVPDFWNGELALGCLILASRVEEQRPGMEETSAFHFGRVFAHPKRDNVFKKSDTLNVLYHIYNAGTAHNRVALSQEISLKSEERIYKLPEQPLDNELREGQVLISGFPIPLGQIDCGEYELSVKIIDKISGGTTEAIIKVVIRD